MQKITDTEESIPQYNLVKYLPFKYKYFFCGQVKNIKQLIRVKKYI